jgi:GNAT superfamily N-acetyltransferase
MKFALLDDKSADADLKAAAELLAEALEDNSTEASTIEEFLRKTVAGKTNARFLLLYDDRDQAAAICAFNLCAGLGGDYVWINNFHVRDEEFAKAHGEALAKELFRWAKEQGCVRVAGAAEKEDYEVRQLAEAFGMEQKKMLLLNMKL